MSKRQYITATIFLSVYFVIGIGVLFYKRGRGGEPQADPGLIAAFLDSLAIDSAQLAKENVDWRTLRNNKNESYKRYWDSIDARRDSLRQYWDSVYSRHDSIMAVRDSVYKAMTASPERPIDLVTADADSLTRIPGIGEALAGAIIAYRERLGGFIDLQQVLEIRHVPAEAIECMYLSSTAVTPLDLNSLSAARIRKHPYINGEQAIALYEARRKYGRLKGWSQVLRLPEFTPADTLRLAPYFHFAH